MMDDHPAVLVLEDGRIFRGVAYGALGSTFGELVFSTGMTGYQETLTDPSSHRQIVVQTAPHIGNTGWNDEDDESSRITVSGYVVREPARMSSSWRATRSLRDELRAQRVVGISAIDTRALTRHIRTRGAMRAGVFSGFALTEDATLLERVRSSDPMHGADLTGEVTTSDAYVVPADGPADFRVAALDLGISRNTSRSLREAGFEAHVLPASSSLEDLLAVEPEGVVLSDGPGDPEGMGRVIELAAQLLQRRVPLFGVGLGNQILARALGMDTYKTRHGHHGNNIPVLDVATGRVAITAQNHGFAVAGEPGQRLSSEFGAVLVSHHCPNDGTVEGLRCFDVPAFAVQYRPQGACHYDEFRTLMSRVPPTRQGRVTDAEKD